MKCPVCKKEVIPQKLGVLLHYGWLYCCPECKVVIHVPDEKVKEVSHGTE